MVRRNGIRDSKLMVTYRRIELTLFLNILVSFSKTVALPIV